MAKTKATRGGAERKQAVAKKRVAPVKKGAAPAKKMAVAKKAKGVSTRRVHEDAVAAVRAALGADELG